MLVVTALALVPMRARAVEIYVRGGAGGAWGLQRDFNDALRQDEAAFRRTGSTISIPRFGWGFVPSGEIGVRVAPSTTVGVSASRTELKVDVNHDDAALAVDDHLTTRVSELAVHLETWLATNPGRACFGLRGGVGRYRMFERSSFTDRADDLPAVSVVTESASWAPTFAAYAGYQRVLVPHVEWFARGGWRHMRSGTLTGTASVNGAPAAPYRPLKSDGRPAQADFTGPFAELGLHLSIGGGIPTVKSAR